MIQEPTPTVVRRELVPFSAAAPGPVVTGEIRRHDPTLSLRFHLQQESTVEIPPWSASPERRDELWRDTCFEAFLAPVGEGRYWELNLSPAGHWNVYRFRGYREGMEKEWALSTLSWSVSRGGGGLEGRAKIELGPIGLEGVELDVGLSAVLRTVDGKLSYYALAHPRAGEGQPDFHHREGLVLRLLVAGRFPGSMG